MRCANGVTNVGGDGKEVEQEEEVVKVIATNRNGNTAIRYGRPPQ